MKVVLDEEEFTGAAARPQSTLADALAEEDDLYRDLNNPETRGEFVMNIKRAKEEIEHTVKAYLAKDALGEYAIPAIRQRPILLMGPPGIGKTQVMEQVARECGGGAGGLYHHPPHPPERRGPALYPAAHYGGKDVSVTE